MSALNKYTQEEKAALILLGFNWVEQDKEWYNDKGKTTYRLYRMSYDNESFIFCLCSLWRDDEADLVEDYEYFDSINQVVEYLK